MITFKDVAPLYLGVEIRYPSTDKKSKKKVRARLTAVDVDAGEWETTYFRRKLQTSGSINHYVSGDILSLKSNGNHDSNALHVKPLLRDLRDITERECRWLYESQNPADMNETEPEIYKHWFHSLESHEASVQKFAIGHPAFWLQLLKWEFDLFLLLPNNLAIRKEVPNA